MTDDEIHEEAIRSIRDIASIAATRRGADNPGAAMLAIIVTAYSVSVAEYLMQGMISLEDALSCTSMDFDIIQAALRKVALEGDYQ